MSKTICVTGGSGFLGSHIIKLLLEKGYTVHTTVRNKNKGVEHLTSLKNSHNLKFFEADLLKDSFDEAFTGCSAVFHTASPFFLTTNDPENDLIKPAVEGTKNILRSVDKIETINTLVVTSSIAAIAYKTVEIGHVWSEEDWSDEELMRTKNQFYQLSKTLAEKEVWKWEETQKRKVRVATINPAMIIGPPLQSTVNTSTDILISLINGSKQKISNVRFFYCDVREVALAHLLILENQNAHGRHLIANEHKHAEDICNSLRTWYPTRESKIPKELDFNPNDKLPETKADTSKLQSLGLKYLSFEQSAKDTVDSSIQKGFL
eukprot:TRINITY_DN2664_c0_g2_i3.p1 TRINITY_DN2664_c0_g2~~TRINITY_DN2664_c0_g2_i3.p1  ORF type:complete len:320 (-),score=69.18 TRINITY_DN2664_c0_g2_i3:65-1024(-)